MKRTFSPRLLLAAVTLVLCSFLAWRVFSSPQQPAPRLETAAAKTEPASTPVVGTSPSQTRSHQFQGTDEDAPSVSIVSDRPRFVAEVSTVQRKAGEKDVDLQKASVSLRDYRKVFHQNPVGNNAEITRLLLGQNSRGSKYLPEDAQLNDKKELTDRWDQPLFFHQISATTMEIRSAGPDRKMWTADDEVLR
jgi:cytoskeletal protein RodZ